MMGKVEEMYRLPLSPISENGRKKVASVLSSLGLI